jgi:hypothetical protein
MEALSATVISQSIRGHKKMCNALFQSEGSHRMKRQFTIVSDQVVETMARLIMNSRSPWANLEKRGSLHF